MIPTGNEFLCVGEKIAYNKTAYFFIVENLSDLDSGFRDQMRKVLIF